MTSHSGGDNEPREGVILPSGGGEPWDPRADAKPDRTIAAPPPGQPWGQPWGPDAQQPGGTSLPAGGPAAPPQAPPAPPAAGGFAGPAAPPAMPPAPPAAPGFAGPQSPPPAPSAAPAPSGFGAAERPVAGELPRQATPAMPAAPPPAPAEEAATELIPLVETTTQIRALPHQPTPPRPGSAPGNNEDATQLIPPVRDTGPADSEGATQLIPPVRDTGPADSETTTQLRVRRGPGHARPHARPDIAETQAMAPVSDDFQSLFRDSADHYGADGGGHRAGGSGHRAGGGDRGRRRSPVAIAVAVVVGCAVIGLIAGAALSGGGDGGGDPRETASSAPATEEDTEPEAGGAPEGDADAAAEQAEALSALLEDSNNSRDSVIDAVAGIRSCRHLNRAAEDLRAAAEQRNGLVTRLETLSLDQLPGADDLAQALTEAWRASAEADEHYAAWADQAKNDPGVCRGGEARHTERASQGDAASGRATEAKERAADLWNPLAREHGLPERAATEL
ncbi:hypothetical protein [Streptomyces litchfieldiae]|uniref:Uncharacterized protein n=1 Tax=Streptomyces litchfieldiae TaxID=3075543 RepID=A0ABU2MQJ9_9ACTN|nr:hypothetical protein [Streptomyces sp. DSM 44938]MDT0343178.1 hypothetical protein [Streptomyces sp. DSM 44938]